MKQDEKYKIKRTKLIPKTNWRDPLAFKKEKKKLHTHKYIYIYIYIYIKHQLRIILYVE